MQKKKNGDEGGKRKRGKTKKGRGGVNKRGERKRKKV